MQTPSIPADEAERLERLHGLGVLDTPPDERFDRLTRLAKRLLQAPIALVSLIDVDRQWFKSCDGLSVSETPRSISFCGHAVLQRQIFVVPDALLDPRFRDNPLVAGAPHIRFYAGVPLLSGSGSGSGSGSAVGTLCVIDTLPRQIGSDDLEMLRDLARMVEQELLATRLASTDSLTGMHNRRGWESLAEHALRTAVRDCKPIGILVLDMDGFKKINDRFGHAEGDRALVDFARIMQQTFRASDVAGRLGGDEFAVLLANSDRNDCENAVLRMRDALAVHNAAPDRGYELRCSVGIANVLAPGIECSIERMVFEADSAMYAIKAARRASAVAVS
jgi:diguanylate cyclase (GGDEF)-like protein